MPWNYFTILKFVSAFPTTAGKQDIAELIGFFIQKNNPRMGLDVIDVAPEVLEILIAYEWPGNIRELKNIIERAMLFCEGKTIDISHLPREMIQNN